MGSSTKPWDCHRLSIDAVHGLEPDISYFGQWVLSWVWVKVEDLLETGQGVVNLDTWTGTV